MKLFELPQNTKIHEHCSDGSDYLTFHRIDGMYSFCTTEKGGIAHPAVWTEVEKIDDKYYIAREEV